MPLRMRRAATYHFSPSLRIMLLSKSFCFCSFVTLLASLDPSSSQISSSSASLSQISSGLCTVVQFRKVMRFRFCLCSSWRRTCWRSAVLPVPGEPEMYNAFALLLTAGPVEVPSPWSFVCPSSSVVSLPRWKRRNASSCARSMFLPTSGASFDVLVVAVSVERRSRVRARA